MSSYLVVLANALEEALGTFRSQMPYELYLQTKWWNSVRVDALSRADNRCQLCNAQGVQLDVHHRTYERRGREKAGDVIVLCHSCHGKFHEQKETDDQPIPLAFDVDGGHPAESYEGQAIINAFSDGGRSLTKEELKRDSDELRQMYPTPLPRMPRLRDPEQWLQV